MGGRGGLPNALTHGIDRAHPRAPARDRDPHSGRGRAPDRGQSREDRARASQSRDDPLPLRHRRPRAFPFAETGALFVGKHGRGIFTNAVNQILRRSGQRAGISKRVYPHIFRHSFGTQYIRNGGDPYTLQRILGHKTSAMVTAYMHMAAQDVEQRHSTASPGDRILPLVAAAR